MDIEKETASNGVESPDEQEMSDRIPVSVQQAEKLKRQALEFQTLMSKFNETFISEDVDTYFVLSLKWLNSWKKHVSYNELINKQNPGPHFGRVSIQHINSDLIDNHVEGCFKYSPLKDHYWNVWMKETLQENIDYIVVNRDIWTFFAGIYQSVPIPRTATGTGANKYVAVKLLRFQAVLLYPNIINNISSGSQFKNTFDKEYLQVDRNYEVAEYIALIQRTVPTFRGDYARDNGVRLWKYSTTSDDPQKTLFTEIKKQVQDLDYNDDHVFDFNGDLIDPTKYTTIEDVGIQANDLIIVEFKSNTKPWCVKNPAVQVEGKCESCYHIKVLSVQCVCRKVAYCTEDCRRNDEKYHQPKCERVGSDDETLKQMVITETSQKGVVGLGNLGNTCFMNSGLQCLSNAFALTDYFLTNKFFDEINESNTLGTKGQLVRKYASLIKKLWCGDKTVVVPSAFKQAVGKFQPMFKGYHQHDSSELITFLLDGIHEDLNRVLNKPYVESKDSANRPDFEVAQESWNGHTARNQSIVVDTMYGQYKSKLKCPNCERVSITFDPYLMVQLGIPNAKKKVIDIKIYTTLVFFNKKILNYEKNPTKTVLNFKQDLAKELQLSGPDDLIGYIPNTYSSIETLVDTKIMNDVRKSSKRTGLSFRILSKAESEIPKEDRIMVPYSNKCVEGYGYKRQLYQNGIFCFAASDTLESIHLKVYKSFQFLFPNQKDAIEVDNVLQYYKDAILNTQYQLEFKSNSSFWQACSFCKKKTCQDCLIPLSEETLSELKEKVKLSDAQCSIELSIVWLKSPIPDVKIFDMFDHYIKNNAIKEETEISLEPMSVQASPNITLQDCLQYSQQPEQLGADNTWYCRQCKDHVQAFKSMQIYKAPKILMFNLKRFKASNRMFKSKLETFVNFPIKGLDMTDYVLNSSLPQEYATETLENNGEVHKKKLIYDLFAISNHFGGLGGGHYTAFAKNHFNQEWYNFDDSHVSSVGDPEQVVTKAAYVLLYALRTEPEGNDLQNL